MAEGKRTEEGHEGEISWEDRVWTEQDDKAVVEMQAMYRKKYGTAAPDQAIRGMLLWHGITPEQMVDITHHLGLLAQGLLDYLNRKAREGKWSEVEALTKEQAPAPPGARFPLL